jgi:hypothetical protein
MSELTFRDFAGAIMADDAKRAAEVLAVLLAVDEVRATAAVTHFRDHAKADPAFMMKAMGLRTAVTSGSDEEIGALVSDCFGIAEVAPVVAELRKRYPKA